MLTRKKEPMVINQVLTTKDYDCFSYVGGNRTVNKLHVERLKKSFREHYLFTCIIVNENMQIIDGQHRYQACKDLKLPLNYIVMDGYGLKEVQTLNVNSKNWTSDDYMNGYCDLNYEDYLIYRDFKSKYKLGHSECQSLLSNVINAGLQPVFNSGKFKIKSYKKAVDTAEKIQMVAPFYDGFKRRSFVFAMITLLENENFNISSFIQKLKIQPTALMDCTSTKQYMLLIEDIYNYKRREKVSLRY
jgi:hypothetical protein